MRKLTVKNFSVIKEAELEFGKITVLIGPQSSGKSLLCKLAYFFQKTVLEIAEECIRNDISFESFGVEVALRFVSSAWFPYLGPEDGSKIAYTDGSYSVVLDRSAPLRHPGGFDTNKFALVHFSDEVSTAYEMTLLRLRQEIHSSEKADYQRYSIQIRERLEALQSPESAIYSYIPSTRAFFVSPQKAIIGTSQRLDPITILFSQDFEFDFEKRVPRTGLESDLFSWISEEFSKILQGEVRVVGNTEVFRAKDGREIPLTFLSSGAQELLPLATCLREYIGLSAAVAKSLEMKRALDRRLFFLEEPEAAVFPSTQYDLVRIFARMANEPALDAHWVITTHSPYILSSFNNLLEAWQVAANKPDGKNEVAKLIDERYWIKPSDFKAYCIHDGKLASIMDEETGLINGNYLDGVSSEIGSQFDELLRIGYVED